MVVLEFLWPTGCVPAEAVVVAMHFFRRRPLPVEIPPDILSGIKAGILVCTSPRSGSNHLAGLMAAAGLGNPLEWFGGRRLLELPNYPRDPRAQVLRALRDGRSPSGIYAVKLFASQFSQVARTIDLPATLPELRYVRLTRRDLLGQAISWARARQTGRFRSTETANNAPRYDGAAIAQSLDKLVLENLVWDLWFTKNGVPFLSLTYEDLLQDPQTSLKKIAGLVNAKLARDVGFGFASGLAIQRDTVNVEWRQRFLAQYSDTSRFPVDRTRGSLWSRFGGGG
ncbi:Stf0 family sulfotransferase [Mesorhizobium sp. Cs1321R2N1]|uniref:Stf0 family sulfotransferase n=1 Tax=Mesorhizobium sp. Cs1321R2N1 TaxID=3015174 RepID=UPI00301C9A79